MITLTVVVLPTLVHTPLLAQSSVDFSKEYSSGDVQVFPTLQAWYAWVNINGTHTIFLALHSNQLPSPVSAFVGESYNTSTGSRVFVANALYAMEVYNDTNHNGYLDANYPAGKTELVYTIVMNASQTFTPYPVNKTIINGVVDYRWGITYGSVQANLLNFPLIYGYGYGGGTSASNLLIDHLSMFYDYSLVGNATYLKASYEIGNVTLVPPTSPNITLNGLSLSLLHIAPTVSSTPYSVTANTSPYDSQTSQTSTQVNVAQINIADSLAYEFRFSDNYELLTNPPVSLRTVYAAAPSNSLPTNAFQGQGALALIRVQDYVKASLPDIAGLPASSDLNYSTSKLIYRMSYPTWGGIGIKHDPTYVAYYVPSLIAPSVPGPWMFAIYLAIAAVAVIAAITFFVFKRTPKRRPTDNSA
jgi:hypothetical protein